MLIRRLFGMGETSVSMRASQCIEVITECSRGLSCVCVCVCVCVLGGAVERAFLIAEVSLPSI